MTAEQRTAWLLSLSADQVTRYGTDTMCDWLAARHAQRTTRLRAACQTLREAHTATARAHARLARLLENR
ncbi:hypothetical protein ACPCSE_29345 [Streptomyces cellulosae]